MPVSHISLPVSHLPASCSFYLSALQPLHYRYLGQHDHRVGFGIDQPDFFLCQEHPGPKPGATHVAFAAPTPEAVDAFFSAAIQAGGHSHSAPSTREDAMSGRYSATVFDFDGNAIEATHQPAGTDGRSMSVVSRSTASSTLSLRPHSGPRSTVDGYDRIRVTVRTEAPPPDPVGVRQSGTDSLASTLVGTLIGAATGAAIAYASCCKADPAGVPRPPFSGMRVAQDLISRALEAPSAARSSVPSRYEDDGRGDVREGSDVSTARPFHGGVRYIEAPPTPRSNPFASDGYEAALSEASSSTATRSRHSSRATAVEAAPSHAGSKSVHDYQSQYGLPPSPPLSVRSGRSHRSGRHASGSVVSASPSSLASFKTATPADIPLPASAATSTVSSRRGAPTRSVASGASSRPSPLARSVTDSIVSRRAEEHELPESRATSVTSAHSSPRSHVSARIEEHEFPESRPTSVASARSSPRSHVSTRTAATSRPVAHTRRTVTESVIYFRPTDSDLLSSRHTLVASSPRSQASVKTVSSRLRAPYPLARSVTEPALPCHLADHPAYRLKPASSVSATTVKPARPRPSTGSVSPDCSEDGDDDDEDDDNVTLGPNDSISCVGDNAHRRRRRRHRARSESGRKKSGAEPEREVKPRSVLSLLGL